jgi:8-amino-7-oxononanoate synthase
MFPVQTLKLTPGLDGVQLHENLRHKGVETVLHRGRNGSKPQVSLLLTASHTPQDIDRLTEVLAQSLHGANSAKSYLKYKVLEAS